MTQIPRTICEICEICGFSKAVLSEKQDVAGSHYRVRPAASVSVASVISVAGTNGHVRSLRKQAEMQERKPGRDRERSEIREKDDIRFFFRVFRVFRGLDSNSFSLSHFVTCILITVVATGRAVHGEELSGTNVVASAAQTKPTADVGSHGEPW